MKDIEEGHPVWEAIDSGGGQCCDVRGVIRELTKRGYVIVPREPTAAMTAVKYYADVGERGRLMPPDELSDIWTDMVDESLK